MITYRSDILRLEKKALQLPSFFVHISVYGREIDYALYITRRQISLPSCGTYIRLIEI
jgi:hypothetical protein